MPATLAPRSDCWPVSSRATPSIVSSPAKRTADLIPLCHPLPLTSVEVSLSAEDDGVAVTATAATTGQTGVEMEAMVAASTALLTLYDMAKAIDKGMIIEAVRLLSKTGGKSGDWFAPA